MNRNARLLIACIAWAAITQGQPPAQPPEAKPTFGFATAPEGPLGYTMGVQLLIDATVEEGGDAPWITITGINKQALTSATLRRVVPAAGYGGPAFAKGATVRFTGYEAAGMQGAPDWARADQKNAPAGPWRFAYHIVAVGPETNRVLPALNSPKPARPADDLPVGQFGVPLGTRIEAEGMVGGGGGTRVLIIDRVNGKALPSQKTINVPTVESAARAASGARFRIAGYETWGRANAPSWARDAASRSGGPVFAYSFVTLKAETTDGKAIVF